MDILKALPYWLSANLRKLVEFHVKVSVIVQKGAPGHDKDFLMRPIWTCSISEPSVGKILTVHHHRNEKKFQLWWFWE